MSARTATGPELADVIRLHGGTLAGVAPAGRKVLNALAACRTAALGGHVEACDHCGRERVAYNSCRNRHCPKCQGSACARWVAARGADLLPAEYFHVVFTLPDAFNGLALADPRAVYDVLFDAVARTLTAVAATPKHLGAKIGFLGVLHTWGQSLGLHPHVHCVVPGGGLSPDGSRWVACRPGFFLPVRVLSRVFRGSFVDLLRRAHGRRPLRGVAGAADLERLIDAAVRTDWVVYAKPPFGGPARVLKYLARYTHRIAISNARLVSVADRGVTFRWTDYARGHRKRVTTLGGPEFLRRFLTHVVPAGFVRVRHFGILANRVRAANVRRCRDLIGRAVADRGVEPPSAGPGACPVSGRDDRCPACGRGHLVRVGELRPDRSLLRQYPWNDTS